MIDTVVLTLKQNMFTILEPDWFSPSAKGLLDTSYRLGGRSNIKCVQNPTPRELKSGIYKPRLTLTRRINRQYNSEITLKIELSVPKLLFGNNFDELENDDFYEAVVVLVQKLKDMGVEVSETSMATASVSAVHFSKNIVLTDGSMPYMYLKQLAKSNINKNLDTNQSDFRNEGHSFKYRTNSFEIAFYDKIKDLEQSKKSEKRAEEKDNQLNLLVSLPIKKPFQVLRIEIRLNRRQKITQILKKIDKNFEPTFMNIFSQHTAKAVLLHYLREIEEAYPTLLKSEESTHQGFFLSLLVDNPRIKLNHALKMMGLRLLLDEMGVRGFRQAIERFGIPAWYSLNKQSKQLVLSRKTNHIFSSLKEKIEVFAPLKLVDFQDKMLNNDKYN